MSPDFIFHNGMAFSAKDKDQDPFDDRDLSNTFGGDGWWFTDASKGVNFNGHNRGRDQCIRPGFLRKNKQWINPCLKELTMTIRKLNDLCEC